MLSDEFLSKLICMNLEYICSYISNVKKCVRPREDQDIKIRVNYCGKHQTVGGEDCPLDWHALAEKMKVLKSMHVVAS